MEHEWTGEDFKGWRLGQGKHWTQTFAADRLGVSRKQVNDWENGRTSGIDRRTILACQMITRALLEPVEYVSQPKWNSAKERVEGKAKLDALPVKYWVSVEYLSDLMQSQDHLDGDGAVWALKHKDDLVAEDLSIRAAMGLRDQNGHIALTNWC